MMLYCNYYIKPNNEITYKLVNKKKSFENWTLIESYIYYNGRIITYETFKTILSKESKKSLFKKILDFLIEI